MPKQELEALAARNGQSAAAKRATIDMLRSKPRAEKEIALKIPGVGEATLLLRAIGAQEYDRLLTKNPPTTEQMASGNGYNIHTFAPALLSEVVADPKMDEKEWGEIWNSPDWSRGEVLQIFEMAVELCNIGMDVVPTVVG